CPESPLMGLVSGRRVAEAPGLPSPGKRSTWQHRTSNSSLQASLSCAVYQDFVRTDLVSKLYLQSKHQLHTSSSADSSPPSSILWARRYVRSSMESRFDQEWTSRETVHEGLSAWTSGSLRKLPPRRMRAK